MGNEGGSDLITTLDPDADGFIELGDLFFNSSCFNSSFLRACNPFHFPVSSCSSAIDEVGE